MDQRLAASKATATSARQAAQAAALSLLLTLAWLALSPLARQPVCCDAGEYLRFARHPGSPVIRPYSTRVLVPWLVHALGGNVVTTFHVVTLACLAIAGLLAYLLARQLQVGHWYALLAMAALECSRGWVYFFYNPYLSDPAAFLLLTGAFLALVRGRGRWLAASLLVLMAATREQFVGFALPAYFWLRQRRLDWRALWRTAWLLAPALLVFAALVKFAPSLPATRKSQPMGLGYTIHQRMHADGWLWFGSAFGMSLGVWWPLAAASLRVDRFRRLAWWLGLVLAYLLLIGWDWGRYALYAFPVVVPAGAATIARRQRHRRLLLGLVALQALAPLADLAAGKPALDHPGPSLPISLLLVLATIVVLVRRDAPPPAGAGDPPRGEPVEARG